MEITAALKNELRRIVWDYAIDDETLSAVGEGKLTTFSLTQEKLYARLLTSTSWYTLLDCVGVDGLKQILSDKVIRSIHINEIREKLRYAQQALEELPDISLTKIHIFK